MFGSSSSQYIEHLGGAGNFDCHQLGFAWSGPPPTLPLPSPDPLPDGRYPSIGLVGTRDGVQTIGAVDEMGGWDAPQESSV